jgi:hypothetical protein
MKKLKGKRYELCMGRKVMKDFIKDMAELDKIWRLFKTIIMLIVALIIIILFTACGVDHSVSGTATTEAKGEILITKQCDKEALQICQTADVSATDLLLCVRYACDFMGSVAVSGISEETLGAISDGINKEDTP